MRLAKYSTDDWMVSLDFMPGDATTLALQITTPVDDRYRKLNRDQASGKYVHDFTDYQVTLLRRALIKTIFCDKLGELCGDFHLNIDNADLLGDGGVYGGRRISLLVPARVKTANELYCDCFEYFINR